MEVIETQTINNTKFGLFVLLFFILGTAATLQLAIVTHDMIIPVIGLVITFAIPLLVRKFFMFPIKMSFSEEKITIQTFSKDSDAPLRNYDFEYNQIQSFTAREINKSADSVVKFVTKDKTSYSFRFIDGFDLDIVNIVTNHILKFNTSIANNQEKITLTPSFVVTQKGLNGLYILSLFLVIVLFVGLVFFKNNQFYLLILLGAIVYLGFFSQRNNELEAKKKWEENNK